MNLRSIRDATQDDPFGFGRVPRPEHSDAVGLQRGGGPCHSCVVRHGPEPTLDGLIEVQLDFGGHRPLLCRGCCALYACTCKYLTLNLGAHANTS